MTAWERRDFPVLRALATTDDLRVRDGFLHLRAGHIGSLGLDLPDEEIHEAVLALADVDYLEGREPSYDSGDGVTLTGLRVTGRGQQALGQWPTFEAFIAPETMAQLLDRLAESAPTEEESGNMRSAARYVRTLGGAVIKAAATAAVSHLVRQAAGLP